MIKVTKEEKPPGIVTHNRVKERCAHGRIVDEYRTPEGAGTGQLICLECLAVFPDPTAAKPAH